MLGLLTVVGFVGMDKPNAVTLQIIMRFINTLGCRFQD
jgi:hypothetical protein